MIKLFKLFESRTAGLYEQEFRKLMYENCKDFINHPILLQRNKSRNDGDFTFINPKVNIRSSRIDDDTGVYSNHHTLLMDNLPSWSEFPKRSESLIGITNADSRGVFGKFKYLVIPYDNAKFGVAPSSDLWGCSTKDNLCFNSEFSQSFSHMNITDKSFDLMLSDLEESYEKWLTSDKLYNVSIKIFKYIKDNNLSVRDGLDRILSPNSFSGTSLDNLESFKLMDYNMLYTNINENDSYEFWTDSKCLLFKIEETGENNIKIEDNINYEYQKFLNEYVRNR